MKTPRLEPEWKSGWRWFSVQANVAAQAVLVGWVFLRDQPLPQWAIVVVWVVLALGLVGRFVKQGRK
jgi:hypothetical protein